MTMGPFETEVDASRAAHEAGGLNYTNEGLLISAVEQARITLGAYDRRIVEWLAGYEPQMCAVVAGLISRAYPVGRGKL